MVVSSFTFNAWCQSWFLDGELKTPVARSLVVTEEDNMGFGRGALLWLLGVPLPIVLLLALFWHH
jgi:hypothetical protein